MLSPNTRHHNLGTSRAGNGTRIWLEGKRLINHGFAHGTQCRRIWSSGRLVLRPCDSLTWDLLPRDERTLIAGTPSRPIIDITGATVAACFPTGQVTVTWSHNLITVEGI